ncbi:MAG: thiazole synthase [Spirochaetales bacterium]|nr:thiazole synthase [Spirochaetales bacterium]
MLNDLFSLGNRKFTSRLMTGSGKYYMDAIIPKVIDASECEILTVALRRVDFDLPGQNILSHVPEHIQLLPNTSGARSADEAIHLARLSRSMGCGNWIKIEVIRDSKYLLPDNYETLKASEFLVKEDFVVLPYITPDLSTARALESCGAAAVMPLGSPIGSNKGLQTRDMIQILISEIEIPVIVDAGIGKPSDACVAMEMGASACLINTAIATASDPVTMARAFSRAIKAGREAFLAGMGPKSNFARPSSPLTGFLHENRL